MPATPARILVVEDSPTMRQLYRVVLGEAALRFAADGLEGLDLAATEPEMDLVIVDINMPRMDGLEFLRRLRGELGIRTPVLVVSTEGKEVDRSAALDAGADAYLRKPWSPQQLFDAIEELGAHR